jgi:hypothetical protein
MQPLTGVEFRALQVLTVKLEHAAMLPLKTKSDAQVSSVWRMAYAHVCSRMLTYAGVCSTIFAAAKDLE